MAESVAPECTPLKERYEGCFNAWYSGKYLKHGSTDDSECAPALKVYQECVKVCSQNQVVWGMDGC